MKTKVELGESVSYKVLRLAENSIRSSLSELVYMSVNDSVLDSVDSSFYSSVWSLVYSSLRDSINK